MSTNHNKEFLVRRIISLFAAGLAAVFALSACTEVPTSLQKYKAHVILYKITHSSTKQKVKLTFGFQTVIEKQWSSSASFSHKAKWSRTVHTNKKNTIEYIEINATSSNDNDLITCRIYLDGHWLNTKSARGKVTC